jgi:hypothetical protein
VARNRQHKTHTVLLPASCDQPGEAASRRCGEVLRAAVGSSGKLRQVGVGGNTLPQSPLRHRRVSEQQRTNKLQIAARQPRKGWRELQVERTSFADIPTGGLKTASRLLYGQRKSLAVISTRMAKPI